MKKLASIFFFIALTNPVFAQDFYIQITPEAGIDSVDTIYNEFQESQVQSILTVLNAYQPTEIDYLISNRPTGNLLELMIQNPDWIPAQLARTLVITFAYPTDVTAVMDNFENHPDIESVSYEFILDPFNFNPNEPISNEDVTLELAYLPSDNCQTPSINSQGHAYHVSINNQTINLDIVVTPPRPPSTTLCGLPSNPTLTPYELGQLDQGIYTVNINHVFDTETFPVTDNQRYYMGNLPLVVRGSGPIQVPTINLFGVILIVFFMLLIVMIPKVIIKDRHRIEC